MVLLIAMVLLASVAAAQQLPRVSSLTVYELWSGPDQAEVRVLYASERSCLAHVERFFIHLGADDVSSSRRIVLERVFRPAEGETVLRLVDDATGWWAELVDRSSMRWEVQSALDYGSLALSAELIEEHDVARSFAWRDARAFRRTATTWSSTFDGDFARAVRAVRNDFEVPSPVEAANSVLQSILASRAGSGSFLASFRPLIRLLDDPASSSESAGATASSGGWEIEVVSGGEGTRARSSEEIRFLAAFETADEGADILEGLRAPEDGGCRPPRGAPVP